MWSVKGLFILILFLNIILLTLKISSLLKLFICFEFFILKVIFVFSMLKIPFENTPILIVFAIAASEAAVALSLLVFLVRKWSGQFILFK